MTKEQLSEELALDYADRVARVGMNYDDAYVHYLERCMNRSKRDLLKQYTVQGLGGGFVISAEVM